MMREREERIRERDVLLREIDHRVKNNLSILASLLSAQKRKATNPEVQEALEDARGRVYSLAKAYDYLNLRSESDEDIEMRSFLQNLVEAVHGSAQIDKPIRMEVMADEWRLDRAHAGAAGLLVNELVTNSIKHAFKGRDGGTIRVKLTAHGDVAELKVEDDGIGFDTTSESAGKGTAFLQALARTARADLICMSGKNGTCYTARLTNSGRAA
jgi:two-component sensor histidine kinase